MRHCGSHSPSQDNGLANSADSRSSLPRFGLPRQLGPDHSLLDFNGHRLSRSLRQQGSTVYPRHFRISRLLRLLRNMAPCSQSATDAVVLLTWELGFAADACSLTFLLPVFFWSFWAEAHLPALVRMPMNCAIVMFTTVTILTFGSVGPSGRKTYKAQGQMGDGSHIGAGECVARLG